MSPNVDDDKVPLLPSAPVAFRIGPTQNPRLELFHSFENRHPAFLDRLNAQTKLGAEFGVGFSGKGRSKNFLFRRTKTEFGRNCFVSLLRKVSR